MSVKKTSPVYFYGSNVGAREGSPLGPYLQRLHREHGAHLPPVPLSAGLFQVRDLASSGRTTWRGTFAHLRDDAPHIVVDGVERRLRVGDDTRFVEKCHFMYFGRANVMAWQFVKGIGTNSRLQDYLSEVIGEAVLLPCRMNAPELDRVLRKEIKEIEFWYQRLGEPDTGAPEWSNRALRMLSSVGAGKAKFILQADRGERLAQVAKQYLMQMIQGTEFSKVKVKLTDEVDPIELFMAPVRDSLTCELIGRYPLPDDVFRGLFEAFNRHFDLT